MHDTALRGFTSFGVGAALTAIALAPLVNWTSLLRKWSAGRRWDRTVAAELLLVRAPQRRRGVMSTDALAQRESN